MRVWGIILLAGRLHKNNPACAMTRKTAAVENDIKREPATKIRFTTPPSFDKLLSRRWRRASDLSTPRPPTDEDLNMPYMNKPCIVMQAIAEPAFALWALCAFPWGGITTGKSAPLRHPGVGTLTLPGVPR